jgi:uncharacterized RDD family membrane protein YckC
MKDGPPQMEDGQQPVSPTPPTRAGTCSYCGQSKDPEEMLLYGGNWICAQCKPVFLQRLREGAALPGRLDYAGFWLRVAAKIIDGMILFVVNILAYIPMVLFVGLADPAQDPESLDPTILLFTCSTYLLQMLAAALYEIIFVARWAATPGKMLLRLRIVMADETSLGWGRATGRYFATLLSGFTLGIGYLIAAFDDERRTLHDHICGTRVILRP